MHFLVTHVTLSLAALCNAKDLSLVLGEFEVLKVTNQLAVSSLVCGLPGANLLRRMADLRS